MNLQAYAHIVDNSSRCSIIPLAAVFANMTSVPTYNVVRVCTTHSIRKRL